MGSCVAIFGDDDSNTEQTSNESTAAELSTTSEQETTVSPADYTDTDSYLAAYTEGIEKNTSAMVDTIAHAAKASANYSSSKEKATEAINFINSNYPDYFTDNDTMEKTMYYGFYLEYAYKKNGSTNLYANLGMDASQAVKDVYCGTETKEDDHATSNLKQIKDSLDSINKTTESKTTENKTTKEKKATKKSYNRDDWNPDITYDQLARTPDDYNGKKITFSGKVLQVMEDNGETQLRIATSDDYDKIMLVGYDSSIMTSRILEDDEIRFYGTSIGLITYQSTFGANITIPAAIVEHIDIQ